MKNKSTQTFELSESDIKEAVRDWIEKKHSSLKPLTVSISPRTATTGIGMNEHDETTICITATREL